ncbi:hypothetical protein BFW01_g3546 [Lasiodiplodia theobromae]|nr:hypothetical protein BFW01_g3546 [Lasiodiplodia theobromae]
MQKDAPAQAVPSRKKSGKAISALKKLKAKLKKTFGRRHSDKAPSAHQPVGHRHPTEDEKRRRFNERRQHQLHQQRSALLPLNKSLVAQSPASIPTYYRVLDWLETLE